MAAIDFPSSPSNGDTHTVGGVTYTYNSAETKWKTTINSNAFLPLTGGTLSGNLNMGTNDLTVGDVTASGTASLSGLTYPTSDGTPSQFLQTNGSGTLSFATVTSTAYDGPTFSAYMASSMLPSQSTWTKATFNTTSFDTDSDFDTTNYRFVPSKAGKYAVFANIYISYGASNTATTEVLAVRKNNTDVLYYRHSITSGGFNSSLALSGVIEMNGTTDYLDVWLFSNSAVPTTGNGTTQTNFSAAWVHD